MPIERAVNGGDDFGVYVHVPFCSSRCDYCAFVTYVGKLDRASAYVDAVEREIATARSTLDWRTPATVYFGGGTPSLLPPGALGRLLATIDPSPAAEITVEANPESATRRFLEEARQAGVTRVSLGAQSFVPHVLAALGRHHDVAAVFRAVRIVGELGFASFNVDLIYGAATESDRDLDTTLDTFFSLDPLPPHLSAYALTVESGTPLARDRARHPDDDVCARRYETIDARLELAGYRWYEISNWAQPGHECRHNLSCWRGGEYRGFGCAAHSHIGGARSANVSSIERYIARIDAGDSPVAWEERLDPEARTLELLELALRTRDGVPPDTLDEDEVLGELVMRSNGRAVLSRRGRMLANEVSMRLHAGG